MRIPASSNFPQPILRREPFARPDAVVDERNKNTATAAVDEREQRQQTFTTIPDDTGSINSPFTAHGSTLYRLDDALANIPPRNRPAVTTYLDIQVSVESFPSGSELVGVDLFV